MSDRSAIFVDAGYVLAEGGRLCCGFKSRSKFSCAYADLVAEIETWVQDHSGKMNPLRTYWYDGAFGGSPGSDHEEIGRLPYVKVRLGRVHHGQQKGVDALIYRDLMTLARERAISRAYLIAGDEDLREGVIAAQDMGVQVVLIGVPTLQRANQSHMLIREADEHVVLPREFWASHFASRSDGSEGPSTPPSAHSVGAAFAESWRAQATEKQVEGALRKDPLIPMRVDVKLLEHAERALGTTLRGDDATKAEVRAGFWSSLRARPSRATACRTSD